MEVLVVPNLFHFTVMEPSELLGTFRANAFCSRSVPLHNTVLEVCDELMGLYSLDVTLRYATLYRRVCAFQKCVNQANLLLAHSNDHQTSLVYSILKNITILVVNHDFLIAPNTFQSDPFFSKLFRTIIKLGRISLNKSQKNSL